jgi:hypothetical protein
MLTGIRTVVMLCLLVLAFAVVAAPPADKFTPGMSYYFEDFYPAQQPWEPGEGLNIEEVFKNYQYYEIVFDKGGNVINVKHYIRNRKVESDKYQIMPNGALQKLD